MYDNMNARVDAFRREMEEICLLVDRVAERADSGELSPARLMAIVAWQAMAGTTFHRVTNALKRLRTSLAQAGGIAA